VKEAFLII